jgi:UDP-N-acetylglucosamine--N-acetylmuramyl-(pentapeptide) pyrophosphoryl-undecaprenol N-acetylglucosamine transferase
MMRAASPATIVVAAGGTGGHLAPAEAVADALLARGARVLFLTDARGAAWKSPVFDTTGRLVLPGGGLARVGLLGAAKGAAGLLHGILRARALLGAERPSAVIGFGGYPSVPPLLAARLLPAARRPALFAHEQNAVMGRANRLLARAGARLLLSFSATRQAPAGLPAEVVGNPVRAAVAALAAAPYAPPGEEVRLLVLGGSLGARAFSELLPAALALLPEALRLRLRLCMQCRAEDSPRVGAALADAGIRAELSPFFADVAERIAAAHLVIARSGASTVAELACIGRPSLLIPFPFAVDDHQAANAAALPGASVLPQQGLDAPALAARLAALLSDPAGLSAAAAAAAAAGRPDAAARIADLVLAAALARQER